MASLRILLTDDALLCLDGASVARKPLGSAGLARMKGWAAAYDAAVRARQPDRLSALGQDIATLLNEGNGWLDDRLTRPGPVSLEIQAAHDRDEGAQILLDAPWELLAPGVLIQGMGNLGKSSLAERIASRLDGHRVVVVFERYDAHAVFHALVAALPEDDQTAIVAAHEAAIIDNPAALKLALQKLLKGPFSGHGGSRPILLIVDDLERILADPQPGERATPFKTPTAGAVIGAVIAAFRDAGGGGAAPRGC